MARTVFANSRNFSHKGSGDKSICGAPDVCKTPIGSATPPIPYPVMSKAGDAGGYSSSVIIDGNPTAIASSSHTMCTGDQPGAAKGLISGAVGDITEFTTYSFDVKVEGEGVVRHMDMTTMNKGNTLGGVIGVASPAPAIQELKEDAIFITLRRKPRKKRNTWWKNDLTLGYLEENYDVELTNGKESECTDGGGSMSSHALPPGKCCIQYPNFYEEIENWMMEQLDE